MIDVKTLEKWKHAQPFRAFEIELDDGRTIVIDRAETIGWSSETAMLMFPGGKDWIDWVPFKQVVAVRARRPGRRRRKAS